MFFLAFFVNYSQSDDLSIGSYRKKWLLSLGKKIRQIWLEIQNINYTFFIFLYIFLMATHTENQVKKSSNFYEFVFLTCGV
jgi:hypothetical protein